MQVSKFRRTIRSAFVLAVFVIRCFALSIVAPVIFTIASFRLSREGAVQCLDQVLLLETRICVDIETRQPPFQVPSAQLSDVNSLMRE